MSLKRLIICYMLLFVAINFCACKNGAAQIKKTITDIDGNIYHTVTIAAMTFTVENAQMTHYRNGDPIRNLKSSTDWKNAKTAKDSGAWCYYDNTNNKDTQKNYGKLYNWYAVKDPRGLAPKGFHVPTVKDFAKLVANLDMNVECQELKSAQYWNDADCNKPNRNKSGFTALPAGNRYFLGDAFYKMGEDGSFWSSTEYNSDAADCLSLFFDSYSFGVTRNVSDKLAGLSVRFVQDDTNIYNSTVQINNTITDIDGNVYHTVTIGNVTFTVENAQTIHYRNGDSIPNVKDNIQWGSVNTGAWCNYDNDEGVGKIFGKLYNWYAVSDTRGLAPQGYHVATIKDYDKLIANLNLDLEGQELKSVHYWYYDADSIKSNRNKIDFTALPAGLRNGDYGNFDFMGDYGCFWYATEVPDGIDGFQRLSYNYSSESETTTENAFAQYLYSNKSDFTREAVSKRQGMSVRFVKN